MLKAIHKSSGKIVSSFKLETDLYWKNKTKEEWIAPKYEVSNWLELKKKGITEVDVSFVKAHTRTNGDMKVLITPHFRSNCEHAKLNPENESELHLIAKEAIYEALLNEVILINSQPLSSITEIEDIEIEHRLSRNKKTKIADVCVIFKEFNPIYGKGIIFEIQLSPQNEETLKERTFHRVAEGFSVVWIFEKDIKETGQLKNINICPTPFSEAIKEYQKIIKDEFLESYQEIEYGLNKRYFDYLNKIKFLEEKSEGISKKISEEYSAIKNLNNCTKEDLLSLDENLKNNFTNEIMTLTNRQIIRTKEEITEIKENLLNSIKQNPDLINKIISTIDLSNISNGIKEKVIEDAIQRLQITIKKEIASYLETQFNSESARRILEKQTEECKRLINESLKDINKKLLENVNYKGKYVIKCGNCSKEVRLSSSEFNGAIICKDCSSRTGSLNLKKIIEEQEKYSKLQREVYNGN